MASTLQCEGDYIVWRELHGQLSNLRSLLQERCAPSHDAAGAEVTTPFEEALNTFIVHLAEPSLKRLGRFGKVTILSRMVEVHLLHLCKCA